MRLRSFPWSKFLRTQENGPRSPEPSLIQEDEETRVSIHHYLRLADQALSTDAEQESGRDDDDQAA